MELVSGLLSSLGLSGAAGLNAYIPLLVVGLLTRADVMHLAAPYDLLAHPWVLLGIAVIGALDFVGDKIPGVDHVLHLLGSVVSTAAGAILFASQAGLAEVPPGLGLALGLVVAGGVHATRTAVRPVATATTGGLANPVLSTAEDGLSLGLSLLAVFLPVLAVGLLLVTMVLAYRVWKRVRRRPGHL
ncbi:DUF4126 domain-containing protein [Deinococcus navajonensis]|uniref:DUF4126 domain-containing protein n=1 Tax=Deinococcus navajonensis TaxID=309884 RepID=A0ABV8XMN9_9DEIO